MIAMVIKEKFIKIPELEEIIESISELENVPETLDYRKFSTINKLEI